MEVTNLLFTVVFAIAIGGASQEARSDTQSAMAGHGWPNHFDTCFGSSWAMMVNYCSGITGSTRLLVIPVQVPASTSTTYYAYARAGGNGTDGYTDCQAFAITGAGAGYDFSQKVPTGTSSAAQTLYLGPITTSTSGTLHFECHVAESGGRVVNVEIR
jgi:hypothetical protein